MPVITKIAQQKKRKDRYSLFLDETYAFSVTEDVLIAFQLRKGKTLTVSEVDTIKEDDAYSRVYASALNYLSYRMRTVQEMELYLKQKEIPPLWTERIIVTLIDEKLLDDTAFADAYVRDRMHQTSKGPKIIGQELGEKGIEKTIVKSALTQYTFNSQYEQALKWLTKERKKKAKHAHKKQEDHLKMKLLQKGFDHTVIEAVFSENKPGYDAESERLIFQKQADKLYRKYSRKLDGFQLRMKLKTALFQRGFQGDMIEAYIDDLADAMEEEI